MQDIFVNVGDSVTFAKTVERPISIFLPDTGDFSVNHVNEQYMARSKFGRRIAHGALIVGYMSTCSDDDDREMPGRHAGDDAGVTSYDRVAFSLRCSSATRSRSPTPIAEVDRKRAKSLATSASSIRTACCCSRAPHSALGQEHGGRGTLKTSS